MDIRSIIDSEDTPPTRKASVPVPVKLDSRQSPAGLSSTQAPAYDNRRDIRPPQPSPLQTPSRNDSHFTVVPAHDNLCSPYQRTSPFGLNNGQHPYAQASNQSPHYPQQGAYYPHREVNTANGPSSGRSFGPSTPSQTPTASTPGSTGVYSAFQRPTSSHSVPTPNSAQQSSNILRESPQPSNTDYRALTQAQGGQRYTSQPGTPLGPPSTYNRPSLNVQRESPRAYSHQRSLSGGASGQHEIPDVSAATRGSPSAYREPRSSVQGHNDSHIREKSVSVSPKTRLPSLPSLNSMSAIESPRNLSTGWSGHGSPARRNPEPDASQFGASREPTKKRTPSRSVGLSGLLNAEPSNDMPEATYRPSQTKSPSNNDHDSDIEILSHNFSSKAPQSGESSIALHQSPQTSHDSNINHSTTQVQSSNTITSNHIRTISPSQPSTITVPDQVGATPRPALPSQIEMTSSFKQAALKTSNGLINAPLPPVQKSSRAKKQPKRPMTEPSETEVFVNDDNLPSQPAKKKPRLGEPEPDVERTATQKAPAKTKKIVPPRIPRYEDVPVFAQSVRGPYRTKDLFEINRNGVRRDPPVALKIPNAAAAPYHQGQANGTLAAHSKGPPSNSTLASDGILGPWEYNIANIEPLDELVREIANFLFLNKVVTDESVGVSPAGGGRGLGAVFEIEAKIGRIIDNNTNDRIHLPVASECVLSRADPSLRTRFESSMTQQQHSTLNKFLNNALVASQGSKSNATPLRKPRIPMTYKHTRETDTLYGLSEESAVHLPKSLAQRKKKVRITTDDKTGEILAKIIKTPVADIHVFCPLSLFDWRISINIEMDFAGDMKDLVAMDKRDATGDRKKDRMSYKHLAYQIDLTQVTSTEPENKSRTHELEIEVSSEEVRRQGQLAGQNKPNEYEKLIKGFVDNVRLLARHCQP